VNECAYLLDAEYRHGFKVFVRFNTGEAGEIDLSEVISTYDAAAPLRDQKLFSEFYLDSWPTLAWSCGFDIAPEVLLNKLQASQQQPVSE
jgi:hypothetical protein